VLPLAGFLAGQGRFWLPAVIVAATIGSIIGALILYGLAAWLGEERVRGLVERYGRFLRVSDHDLDRADVWFDQHGGAAVALGRLVPVVRSLVSIPAGLRRMPLGRFVLFTAAGSAVWNSVLIGLGWLLGDNWTEVDQYATYIEIAVLIVLAAGVVAFLNRRRIATR
jgi:membrane protein DedA with SNARE-associated domain